MCFSPLTPGSLQVYRIQTRQRKPCENPLPLGGPGSAAANGSGVWRVLGQDSTPRTGLPPSSLLGVSQSLGRKAEDGAQTSNRGGYREEQRRPGFAKLSAVLRAGAPRSDRAGRARCPWCRPVGAVRGAEKALVWAARGWGPCGPRALVYGTFSRSQQTPEEVYLREDG